MGQSKQVAKREVTGRRLSLSFHLNTTPYQSLNFPRFHHSNYSFAILFCPGLSLTLSLIMNLAPNYPAHTPIPRPDSAPLPSTHLLGNHKPFTLTRHTGFTN